MKKKKSKKTGPKKKLDFGSIKKVKISDMDSSELLDIMVYAPPYTSGTSTCCYNTTRTPCYHTRIC